MPDWVHRILQPFLERLFWFPRVKQFTAATTAVIVDRETGGTSCVVRFGRHFNTDPGIEFTVVVTLPSARASGTLELVQDIALHRRRSPARRNPNATHECVTSRGVYMLDETDPYEGIHISDRGPHRLVTNDTPGNYLSRTELVEVDDKFRMFLMWTPDRFGGVFRLPVQRIDWWWKASVESNPQNAQCQDGREGWRLTSQPTDHGNTSPGRPTFSRPVTNANISTVKAAGWLPC